MKTDFTTEMAKDFLLDDFIKSVKRTRFLYLETEPKPELGYGFFEPIMLILCWCDFMGALYTGKGEWKEASERSEIFIKEVMSKINPKYAQSSNSLVKNYRHGSVHAYAPGVNFNILINEPEDHLKQNHRPHVLKINVNSLIDDFEQAIILFAANIKDSDTEEYGTISAFNKVRRILLKYEDEQT